MIQLDNLVQRYRRIIFDEFKKKDIKAWVAGGCLRDYFMGAIHKTDHDMFFPDEKNLQKALMFFLMNGGKIKLESDNGVKISYEKRTFDLIKHYFPTPEECISNFDFTVAMFAVDYDKVYHGETSFIDLSKRQLMINALPYPISTMSRALRYYQKGFAMCVGEQKKLAIAINKAVLPDESTTEQSTDNADESSGDGFFTGID